ncbi:MAG: tetratricopeptide repeat protein [Gemmatimonadales bacterium]|nr:tetratricopeptide repeat protein [Gemmatimonadales bacterium]
MTRKGLIAIGALGLCLGTAQACTADGDETLPRASAGVAERDAPTSHRIARRDSTVSGVHAEALELERRMGEDPNNAVAILELAQLFESTHELEQAARYYRRLLTINRGSRDGWIGLARVYLGLENVDAAEEGIATFLHLSPGDAEAMYLLGVIHAHRGDYAAARVWWRKVEQQAGDPQLAKQAAQSLQKLAGSPS